MTDILQPYATEVFQQQSLSQKAYVLSGKKITHVLSKNDIKSISKIYSDTLSIHQKTMLQLIPAEVEALIKKGLMVLVFHPQNRRQIVAGARIMFHKNNTYEICSWVAFVKGFGKTAIGPAKKLALTLHPKAKLFAVIETGNIYAQYAMKKSGALMLSQKPKDLTVYLAKEDGTTADVGYFELL